ncbi:putative flavoprotein involved in K+ transport [Sphingobium sp. AP50]|uniref:flavin-containing monooxygenase n=1 Tax=Sphingobium sp. AP50 TaxID=1884369 RepID=UPI0008D58A35|nr:NAD(P)/FAD-dependent oxidoreductase [Sphingobium sp. AP50]SEK05095.1 putative flavoprotein involved in K+ transport [Sphingobium sp. AP50]
MNDAHLQAEAAAWVADFEAAITAQDRPRLTDLFCDPSYFRDNGALTWDYRQFHGRETVVSTLLSLAREVEPNHFRLSEGWPSPQVLGAGDAAIIEAFFDFETKDGSAVLLLNAVSEGGVLKARAIFTRLEDLKIIEQAAPYPRGRGYTPSYSGETWKEHRDAAQRYDNVEPEVMVIGAGQAGLTTSAYLRKFGVDVLNVDRHERVGDSWNKRYDSLFLHNPIEMNDFPFLSFPPHYPEYLPKDLIGEWLDLYARYMDLNVWTSTTFKSAHYDSKLERWDAVLGLPDGSERVLHPRHIVLATGGIGGKPSMPSFPGLDSFAGKVIHSSHYTRNSDYGIKKAIIIGVATSAHDIARDLVEGGVAVTMFQRDAVVINNVATANLAYAGYMDPDIPTPLVDIRYGIGLINPLREKASQAYHKMAQELDRPLLSRLEAAGLRLGDGVNGQGWLDLFLRSGGGYYLNTGTSELIADGSIKIEPFQRIVEFVPTGAKLDDGRIIEADIVILATGYQSRRTEVVDFFGDDVADKVGEIARLDPEGEWANIWGQTAQRGLWFNGGGINQMRPGSARLALLIKADLAGLIPEALRRGESRLAYEKTREAVG